MKLNVLNVRDVAEAQLCCGCGACAYAAAGSIEMADVLEHGRRPFARSGGSETAIRDALQVCPGIEMRHTFNPRSPGLIAELAPAWGPVLELWEGFAADPEIRFAGSSGGAATALSLFCIERGGMHGVLHIAQRPDVPYLNHTVLSTTRTEMLAATGSRYSPASPCDGLQKVEDAPAPCVFIGKPCDVAATSKARVIRPALDEKLGLTIAIFCAGTPSTRGTLEMLVQMGISDPSEVTNLRFRGMGWPGKAVATTDSPVRERREMTYARSWGDILQKHRQWRCHLCVDHTGEFADIAVGDPWYRPIGEGEPGRSLVVVRRADAGRNILREVIAAGYVKVERVESETMEASQPGFPTVRGSVWGRLLTCRLMGVPTPRYINMPMQRFWWRTLTLKQKAQSFYGTIKRIFRRGLRRQAAMERFHPPAHKPHPTIEPSTFETEPCLNTSRTTTTAEAATPVS